VFIRSSKSPLRSTRLTGKILLHYVTVKSGCVCGQKGLQFYVVVNEMRDLGRTPTSPAEREPFSASSCEIPETSSSLQGSSKFLGNAQSILRAVVRTNCNWKFSLANEACGRGLFDNCPILEKCKY